MFYMKKKGIEIHKIFALAIIFLIFCFFRFYNLDKRLSFGWDQEQFSYQIKQIVQDHQPVLIGRE